MNITNRNYYKIHNGVRLQYVQATLTEDERKKYGFITKWNLYHDTIGQGEVIQKYTGKMISIPSARPKSQARERQWIYRFHVGAIKIEGSTTAMNKAVAVLVDLIVSAELATDSETEQDSVQA